MKKAIWKSNKSKFKKWVGVGSYSVRRGDRHFVITNTNSGKTHVYESHEAAKKDGWFRIKL